MNGYNKTNLKTFKNWLTENQSNRKLAIMAYMINGATTKLHALTIETLQLTTYYFYVNVAYAYSLNLHYSEIKSIEYKELSNGETIYVLIMTHFRAVYLSNNVYNLY